MERYKIAILGVQSVKKWVYWHYCDVASAVNIVLVQVNFFVNVLWGKVLQKWKFLIADNSEDCGEEVVDQLFYLVNMLTLHGGVSDM